MILICALYCVVIQVAANDKLRPLFRAIRVVETSAVAKPQEAVGDNGRSIGPYQISHAYWKDSGLAGKWRHCRGRAYSEAVMLAYWKRHCPESLRSGEAQVLARVHNGGPKGQRRNATWAYWGKVRKHLTKATCSAKPRLRRPAECAGENRVVQVANRVCVRNDSEMFGVYN